MKLDEKGRCCGRKPIDYKSGAMTAQRAPHKFCDRCCRSFSIETGEQIENWKWENIGGEWKNRKPVKKTVLIDDWEYTDVHSDFGSVGMKWRCPDCGGIVVFADGAMSCCGYSWDVEIKITGERELSEWKP